MSDPVETLRISARSVGAFGPERALQAWLDVLAVAPNDPESLAAAGSLLVATGKHPQGLVLLDQAIALGSAAGEVFFQRASGLFNLGKLEEAVAAFEAAESRLDPDTATRARGNRVAILQRLGRAAEALSLQEEAGTPADDDADGWYHRGLAQVKAARYEECVASITRVLLLEPDHANAHYTIACAWCLSGQIEPALAAIRRAIECDPDTAAQIAGDSDFASIKNDTRFLSLVAPRFSSNS